MSDEGEKTCPLCAEEMDLTDQQLKPCKCGYEICVWCWHHIMDMAEKDNIEGRCPACRSPYNKEKIVGMAAKCERLVAEMSMEKKVKSKSKSKTPDGRNQLSSVRVIQRNLVYIVGLPLSLADEDLLQQKEYFAQYGNVLKVSISRTAAGTIQHFANNTCSVYITYSKEEEAIRCIQSVHGFTLEGRPLRACFGTTKYCHAWLRNVPCSNPDCLYLHEIGTQEDSFSKDEIISAYTRSRVQQITGATIDMQRRSGNVLPPPADEFCNNSYTSSGKTISKSATNDIDICSDNILGSSVWQTPASSVRGSPPNSSSGRSVGLPAAASWGMRASNSQPQSASMVSSNGPSKQKSDICSASLAFSTAVASRAQVSILHGDSGKKRDEEVRTTTQKGKLEPVESVKLYMDADHRRTPSDTSTMIGHSVSSVINSQLSTPPLKDKDESVNVPANLMKSFDLTEKSCGIGPEKGRNVAVEGKVQNLCSDMSSLNIDRQGLNRRDTEQYREPLTSHAPAKAVASSKGSTVPRDQSESRLDSQAQVVERATREVEDDLVSFDVQRLEDPEVVSHTSYLPSLPSLSQLFRQSDSSRVFFPQQAYGSLNVNVDPLIVDKKLDKGSLPQEHSIPVISNGCSDNRARNFTDLDTSANQSYMLPNEGKIKHVGRYEGEMVKNDGIAANDMGENSIISNILSMDFDSWDESLASPQNLAKLLGETDKQQGSLGVSSSWKVQNSNQSRFSFAREEDQVSNFEPSFSNFGQAMRNHSFGNGFVNNSDFFLDNAGNSNGFSTFSAEEPGNFASIHSHYSSNKFSVSRAQVSVPPGFSGPSRAPPPGFTPHERMEQTFDMHSGNNFLDNSSLSRKPYQAPPAMNIGTTTADIEFLDPAILAVGKGRLPGGLNSPGLDMRSTFPPQISTYENDARLQLLMQRSLSPHQNQRYVETGDNFSSRSDGYGMPTRIMDQTVNNNLSPFSQFNLPQSRSQLMSNGNWNGWSEVQRGNDMSMSELLRTERLEINKFFNGYEDSKFRMPSSGDLYNRTYGI